jgi:hypothetical protein
MYPVVKLANELSMTYNSHTPAAMLSAYARHADVAL